MANKHEHIDLGEQILKTLLYFDIFNYPLKACEIFKFLGVRRSSQDEVVTCLDDLIERKYLFRFGDLYSLHADERHANRRLKGNREAEKWMKIAERKARFIGKFPFVLGVMASGSLSKGYMDEKSDLDFFIVTAPKKLWVARMLLVLYKRIFLSNSHKQFCVNYFVDAAHLEIEEKNLFTATELATLIPLYNDKWYRQILMSNAWVKTFFPNFRAIGSGEMRKSGSYLLKTVIEFLLSPASHLLDRAFMGISLLRWRRLYSTQYSKEDFEIAFKTRRYVSKNHPNHYQKKILELYQGKLGEFENRLTQLTAYE